MRLIDADLLEKAGLMLMKLSDKQDKLLTKFEWKDVPTAYDVEKVVEQIKSLNGYELYPITFSHVLEIIRKGGVE